MLKVNMHARSLVGRIAALAIAVIIVIFVLVSITRTTYTPLHFLPSAGILSQSNPDPLLDDIRNATLGFERIFCISLPFRTDQRDAMTLAATLTGIELEHVDGVLEVDPHALPPGSEGRGVNKGAINTWRAHMNVMKTIVERNLSSALILEGDVDWDIRIKSQLQSFALASRALIQPLKGKYNEYLDPTYPEPKAGQTYADIDIDDTLGMVVEPKLSPYGDNWDILWLGHCGASFPDSSEQRSPLGRIIVHNDDTVPQQQHLETEWGTRELLGYPPHTRVVSHARENTCTVGYAVSQRAARSILYEFGVRTMTGPIDLMLREYTHGLDGRPLRPSLSVQPQLFQHHRTAGPRSHWSDINSMGDGINERPFARNIRWSTRVNFPVLTAGSSEYIDTFPDGQEKPSYIHPD